MKCAVVLCGAFIIILGFYVQDSSQILSTRCQPPKLENGRVRQKLGGRVVRFNCMSGFTLAGSRSATCRRGGWSFPTPVCIKLPCPPIVKPTHSLVIPLYNGAYLMFLCEPGYERIGSSEIYCNGRSWNATAPTCTKYLGVNPPTSCDFEKRDLCSWKQDPFHDFDWVIQNFNTPSWHISTGPSHDHTLGQGRDGYYLYIEADDKLENSTARIMSPLYSSDLTNAGCFSFWYHMYGETVGTLNVYFKLEGEANRTLKFTKSGNQGNHWWHGFFNLPKANSSFQLIVEGVRGASYQSDIALDDVAILQGNDCIIDLNTTTEIITTDADDQIEIVNGMQSCLGRCTYSNTTEDSTSPCQCGMYCFENQNCCPDYTAYCILGNDNTDSTIGAVEVTTLPSMKPKVPSTGPDHVPIPANPRDNIDPYPPNIGPKISSRRPTVSTAKPPTTSTKSNAVTRKPMGTSTVRIVAKTTTKEEKFDNQIDTHNMAEKAHSTSSRERSKVTLPGIIAIVFGAIVGIAGTGLIVFRILQKRNSYKNKSGTSALSDDSDVRFLTSDEMLDFNIAKPEDMEM